MDQIEAEINKVNRQLDEIEVLLRKPSSDWSEEEKDFFVDKDQLRGKEKQLREEKKQLREEKKQLGDKELELLKQKTILLQKDQNLGIV